VGFSGRALVDRRKHPLRKRALCASTGSWTIIGAGDLVIVTRTDRGSRATLNRVNAGEASRRTPESFSYLSPFGPLQGSHAKTGPELTVTVPTAARSTSPATITNFMMTPI
jgi:hypothetical protein